MLRAWLTRSRHVVLALGILFCAAAPAFADDDDEVKKTFREPGIEFKKESTAKAYIDWLFGALLIAGSAFLLFKNPHRSHLD